MLIVETLRAPACNLETQHAYPIPSYKDSKHTFPALETHCRVAYCCPGNRKYFFLGVLKSHNDCVLFFFFFFFFFCLVSWCIFLCVCLSFFFFSSSSFSSSFFFFFIFFFFFLPPLLPSPFPSLPSFPHYLV